MPSHWPPTYRSEVRSPNVLGSECKRSGLPNLSNSPDAFACCGFRLENLQNFRISKEISNWTKFFVPLKKAFESQCNLLSVWLALKESLLSSPRMNLFQSLVSNGFQCFTSNVLLRMAWNESAPMAHLERAPIKLVQFENAVYHWICRRCLSVFHLRDWLRLPRTSRSLGLRSEPALSPEQGLIIKHEHQALDTDQWTLSDEHRCGLHVKAY